MAQDPLPLATFARLSIAQGSQKNTALWEVFLKQYCPATLLDDLLFIIKIAYFNRKQLSYSELNLKQVATMLLRTCLREPQKMFFFEEEVFGFYDPFKTVNLIKELIPLIYLPIFGVLRGNCKIMLNHYEVLKIIIQLNNRVVVINNLLHLSVLYNRLDVAKLCVKYGADDFDTAGRIASLSDPIGVINDYIAEAEMSDICRERYSRSMRYRQYHNAIANSRHCDPYTKYLSDAWLRKHFQEDYPLFDRTILIGNIDRPVTTWSFTSFLKSLNYVHHFEIDYIRIRHVARQTESFLRCDNDQYIRNNCAIPVKKRIIST